MNRAIVTAVVALFALMSGALAGSKVTPLISKTFADLPGKEGLMITVDLPPGAGDPIHRHDAHVFVYVLEGAVRMQVKGGEEVTVSAGSTFYEAPSDIHVVGRNASDTAPAKMLVFMVKDVAKAPVLPAQ